MSKDIWHKADEIPKAERYFIEHYKVVVGDKVYWKYGLFKGVSDYDYPFDQDTARWCYLDDLLALETELDRTRKALGIIKKEMSKEIMPDFAVIHNALKMAEQKDVK